MISTNQIKKEGNQFYRQFSNCEQGITGVYMKYQWKEISEKEFEQIKLQEHCEIDELQDD